VERRRLGRNRGEGRVVRDSLNDADLNGQKFCHWDILHVSRTPNVADLNGQKFCHWDILHVSRTPNVADLNGQQLFHSDILPIPETTNVASFYGQQMQSGITSVSPITKFYDVPERSMQHDIVFEAILASVADADDQHMQDDIIHVSLVTNDVDQDIVHDTSHVVAKSNDSHIAVDHIRDTIPLVAEDNFDDVIGQHKIQHGEEAPCHKDKSDCIPIKDSVNNSAGSLTNLSEVTDDQGGPVVDKSDLNENIYVVASKDEVGSNDILNEVAYEVVSDDKVSEAATNDEDMDVDKVVSNDKVSNAAANDEVMDVDDVDMFISNENQKLMDLKLKDNVSLFASETKPECLKVDIVTDHGRMELKTRANMKWQTASRFM
nr:hypothetical protein [Tanacetum cinerariifolium]